MAATRHHRRGRWYRRPGHRWPPLGIGSRSSIRARTRSPRWTGAPPRPGWPVGSARAGRRRRPGRHRRSGRDPTSWSATGCSRWSIRPAGSAPMADPSPGGLLSLLVPNDRPWCWRRRSPATSTRPVAPTRPTFDHDRDPVALVADAGFASGDCTGSGRSPITCRAVIDADARALRRTPRARARDQHRCRLPGDGSATARVAQSGPSAGASNTCTIMTCPSPFRASSCTWTWTPSTSRSSCATGRS